MVSPSENLMNTTHVNSFHPLKRKNSSRYEKNIRGSISDALFCPLLLNLKSEKPAVPCLPEGLSKIELTAGAYYSLSLDLYGDPGTRTQQRLLHVLNKNCSGIAARKENSENKTTGECKNVAWRTFGVGISSCCVRDS